VSDLLADAASAWSSLHSTGNLSIRTELNKFPLLHTGHFMQITRGQPCFASCHRGARNGNLQLTVSVAPVRRIARLFSYDRWPGNRNDELSTARAVLPLLIENFVREVPGKQQDIIRLDL
jgi:hypothetical protein